jgi:hypothetical protein
MTAFTGGTLPTFLAGQFIAADEMYVLTEAINYALEGTHREATQSLTADSSTFTTTETEIGTVTANLVAGATYRPRVTSHIGTSVANDIATCRIREDSVAGQQIQERQVALPNAGVAGNLCDMETEYTAVSTGAKTFSFTAARSSGSGNLRREAQGDRPHIFYVDYVRG